MLVLAIPAGLLIGLSLGALGGGGSILTVPARLPAASACARRHDRVAADRGDHRARRYGRARPRRARPPRSGNGLRADRRCRIYAGTRLSASADPHLLLTAFAALMLVAAAAMVLRRRREAGPAHAAGAGGTASDTAVLRPGPQLTRAAVTSRRQVCHRRRPRAQPGRPAKLHRYARPCRRGGSGRPAPRQRAHSDQDRRRRDRGRLAYGLFRRRWRVRHRPRAGPRPGLRNAHRGRHLAAGHRDQQRRRADRPARRPQPPRLAAARGLHRGGDRRFLVGHRVASRAHPVRLTLAFAILLTGVAAYTAARSIPYLV